LKEFFSFTVNSLGAIILLFIIFAQDDIFIEIFVDIIFLLF